MIRPSDQWWESMTQLHITTKRTVSVVLLETIKQPEKLLTLAAQLQHVCVCLINGQTGTQTQSSLLQHYTMIYLLPHSSFCENHTLLTVPENYTGSPALPFLIVVTAMER